MAQKVKQTGRKGTKARTRPVEIVEEITGSEMLHDAIYADYRVVKYRDNKDVPEEKKKKIKWSIKIGSKIYKIKRRESKYGVIEDDYYAEHTHDKPKELEDYKGDVLNLEITKKLATLDEKSERPFTVIAHYSDIRKHYNISRGTLQVTAKWSGVGDFMSLVRILETEKKDWSSGDIGNYLLNVSGFGVELFRVMIYGDLYNNKIAIAKSLIEYSKNGADPKSLPLYTKIHSKFLTLLSRNKSHVNKEAGVVSEFKYMNSKIALSHVLCGIVTGFYRKKKHNYLSMLIHYGIPIKITSYYLVNGALKLIGGKNIGERIDNLYSITIAGDIGQQAVKRVKAINKGADRKTLKLIGNGTEATYPELIADIDGFNIGNELSNGNGNKFKVTTAEWEKPGKGLLSKILNDYYSSDTKVKDLNRICRFKYFDTDQFPSDPSLNKKSLFKNTINFAETFMYKPESKDKFEKIIELGEALISLTHYETQLVFNAFEKWFKNKLPTPKSEKTP